MLILEIRTTLLTMICNNDMIDFKKLKEEYIDKTNKRVKVRSIFINIKANRFNKRFDRFNEV